MAALTDVDLTLAYSDKEGHTRLETAQQGCLRCGFSAAA